MRIAVDARPFEARPTGAGRYLEGLLAAWLLRYANDSFVMLSPRPVFLPPSLEGRVDVAAPSPLPGTVWLQTAASKAAVRAGADAFFGTLSILPLASSLPGVATVHDLTPLLFPEWHSLKNRLGFAPFLGPTVRRAHGLAAVSEATRRDLVARYPEAAGKCVVVPHGASFEKSEGGPAPNGGRPYVLFLGTLEPRKNVSRLVRAMEAIWDRRPGFPDLLLAGGEGWKMQGFEAQLRSSRHAGRIRRAGYVDGPQRARLLAHARCLAYPSLYEGFGLPALEAMAAGTVVVGSSSSSLPEVLGDAGLLPDPSSEAAIAEALEKADGDEAWRTLATERGLERAGRFTWSAAADAMRGLFERAIAGRTR